MPVPPLLTARIGGVAIQAVLTVAAVALAIAVPPARGAILLVPLGRATAADALNLATDGGARLVTRGPLPGSVVVFGDRDRLFARLLAHGILPVSASRLGCVA